jgi:hypothetical protein
MAGGLASVVHLLWRIVPHVIRRGMKFLMRWAIRLLILSIVLVVALILLKDTLFKAMTEYRLRSQTGLDVRIGKLELGLSSPRLTLEDFKIYNSPEFGGSPLVHFPELHLECDGPALALGRFHVRLLRLHLSEVNIVESKDGRTNILVLLDRLQEKSGPSSSNRNLPLGLGFQGIDILNLTVGKVKYSSVRRPSRNSSFDVGLTNEVLMNVKSIEDLSGLLLKIIFRKGFNILSGSGSSPIPQLPPVGQRVGANQSRPNHSAPESKKASPNHAPPRK